MMEREMTLAEWVGKLPSLHLAHREYLALLKPCGAENKVPTCAFAKDLASEVAALREAAVRAERKLSAYVGVCNGDKELTDAVLPMLRRLLADQPTVATKCPDGLLPDGPICPQCRGRRGPSGIGGGTWVHY